MNIDDELESLKTTFDNNDAPTILTIQQLDELIKRYPNSAKLHVVRGNYIQLEDSGSEIYELDDAKHSYIKALEIDSNCAEAHESLGYYLDVFEGDLKGAEKHFRTALLLNESLKYTYMGLARVLAEQGKISESREVISNKSCKFSGDVEVQILKDEITQGMWCEL
jgi:tetratricopeptide (TPR) repeat protein